MSQNQICERTLTEPDTKRVVTYCSNKAYYISPPGHYTSRVIKVCERCKQAMLDLGSNSDNDVKSEDFARL